jgi:DNA-binding CsgD family transcriptional regulator
VIWSPELRLIIGVGPDVPASPHTFIGMIHPDDRAWAQQSMAESLRTGVAEQRPFRIVRPDGHVRVLRGPAITTRQEQGRPVYMVGVLQDIGGEEIYEELARAHQLIAGMSERERQVLLLVVQGSTSKGIAAVLGLSPKTVETYRSRIMTKLHVDDLAALIRFSIRNGLMKA